MDPLSIAASVTGVSDFGLKTCTAVTNYLDAIRSRSQEIERAEQEVQTVQHLLTTTDKSTEKISSCHESSKSAVRACLASCNKEIAALEALIPELQGSTAVSQDSRIWQNIRDQGKKLTYPFHRSKLDRLQAQLAKVTGTLQVALQVAGINVVVGIENTVMTIHTSTLPKIQEQLDSFRAQLIADPAQVTEQILESNRLIREDLSLVKSLACEKYKNLELLAGVLAVHHQPSLVGALSYQQAVGRLMAKPSQLKELCQLADDQISDPAPDDMVHPNSSFQSSNTLFANGPGDLDTIRPVRSTCSCRQRRFTRQKIAALASWVFSSQDSKVQPHMPDCPFRNCVTGTKQTRWEVRFAGLRGLISCAVGLSFSASFGAGGFSLSPNFTYYPSVSSSTTPVFRIMDLLYWFLVLLPCPPQMQVPGPDQAERDRWAQTFLNFIDLCIDNIMILYEKEKAAPRAIDEYGRSVLHHLSRSQKIFRYGQVPFVWFSSLRHYVDNRFLYLANGLIRCGVPSMMQDIYGVTPAWDLCIVSFQTEGSWADRAYHVEPNGPATIDLICSQDPYTPILAQSSLVGGNSFLGNDVEPMSLLPLLRYSQAVAEGDEKEIERLLASHPSTLQERNLFGQTPLHLGVGRPACMRLLLHDRPTALLDQPDSSGYTPLEYAVLSCSEPCEGSMIVMLESDCRIPNQFSRMFSRLCRACASELLKHIQNRRERLKMFALARLPGAEASALGLHQRPVLDSKANLVTRALEKRGFEIPSHLRLDVCLTDRVGRLDMLNKEYDLYQPVSMFHQNPLNTPFDSDFEALFQLRFRDFEEPVSPELSPLLSWLTCPLYVLRSELEIWEVNRINACIWLIDRGANLWDPISGDNPATTAHYLYASMNLLEEKILMTGPARLKTHFLTRTLSTQDVRDDCHCRCSPGGCSPFVWFLRSNTDQNFLRPGIVDHGTYIIDLVPPFLRRCEPILSMEQLRSAIRYLTFEILGIRHTCSHDYTQVDRPTADEIEELMSEDASLLELLGELVEDFDSELQSFVTEEDPLGLPFWETYWSTRMKEVIGKFHDYRMDESELLSAQRLGVTWHHLDDNTEKHQVEQAGSISQGGTDNVSYRESDWSVEVDDVRMWRTLQSMGDWTSRLDLIMSRAIPDWR